MSRHFLIFSFISRYKKTVPQVLIRWSVQKNYITIPKSSRKERILENADVFDFVLSEEDMNILVSDKYINTAKEQRLWPMLSLY